MFILAATISCLETRKRLTALIPESMQRLDLIQNSRVRTLGDIRKVWRASAESMPFLQGQCTKLIYPDFPVQLIVKVMLKAHQGN